MNENHAVYIMTNKSHTIFYTGRTADLAKRVWQHKNKEVAGFTKKYNIDKLVYYEIGGDLESTYAREIQIKKWPKAWKKNLIESKNPYWKDLSELFLGE